MVWKPATDGSFHQHVTNGGLCPYHAHSIGSRDSLIPRYSDSKACVRCIASLSEGKLNLDVHKVHKLWRRRFLEFWSLVQINEPDDCWQWRGKIYMRSNRGRPGVKAVSKGSRHRLRTTPDRKSDITAQRAAIILSWGDIGLLPYKRICDTPHCCNPLHLRVLAVPHFLHNRDFEVVDFAFNARKLAAETHSYLAAMSDLDPERMEGYKKRTNREWIEHRIKHGAPDAQRLIHIQEDLD